MAPLLRRPPTDKCALYTALCLAQGISAFAVGPNQKAVITLDLDLYERAIKLQSSSGNNYWILRVGELHACLASFHAAGKYLEGSGLETISIKAGLYSPSTIRQIFTGKWFKRGIEYHYSNIMACNELLLEAVTQNLKMEATFMKCNDLRNKLHQRADGLNDIFKEISLILTDHLHGKLNQDFGEVAKFLRNI